jgi:hypothetical protein
MEALLLRTDNRGVLAHLAQGRDAAEATFGPPPAELDRWHLGAHPDVIERLWEVLNAALPEDCRWLVFDTPALVHPASGQVLAVVLGTSYAVRLLPDDLAAAVAAGAELVHTYRSVGTVLDLPASFGPDWAFGRWDQREGAWLAASHRAAG